jgi:hypothetical protein
MHQSLPNCIQECSHHPKNPNDKMGLPTSGHICQKDGNYLIPKHPTCLFSTGTVCTMTFQLSPCLAAHVNCSLHIMEHYIY